MSYLIESIELHLFTGMKLNNVTTFKFSVNSDTTIFIGRNGSGKSRLMSMLTPLSAEKADFRDGGFKVFIFSFDGIRFEVKSEYCGKHLKNTLTDLTTGDVIHERVNPSVHNRVIKDMFGYTSDFHSIVTGITTLTQMKGPERKKWFSMLSETNLTYALKFYAKAREHDRDLTGTIKSLKYSIGALRPAVVAATEEREEIERRIDELRNDIQVVEREINVLTQLPIVTGDAVAALDMKINALTKSAMSLDVTVEASHLDIDLDDIKRQLSRCEDTYAMQMAHLNDIDNLINTAKNAINVDIDSLVHEHDLLVDYIDENKQSLIQFPTLVDCEIHDLKQAMEHYDDFKETLLAGVRDVKLDYHVSELRDNYYHYMSAAKTAESELLVLHTHEQKLTEWLKEVGHVSSVTCDNCNHVFKPGITNEDLERRKQQSENLSNRIAAKVIEVEEKNAVHEAHSLMITRYDACLNVFKSYRSSPTLELLFNKLQSLNIFTREGAVCGGLIGQFGTELSIAIAIGNAATKLERLDMDIKLARAQSETDTSSLEDMRKKIDRVVEDILTTKQELVARLNLATNIEERMAKAALLEESLYTATEERGRAILGQLRLIKLDTLKEHRELLWGLLTAATQRFESLNEDKRTLTNLEGLLASNLSRQAKSQAIVKASSPDSGFLAKYIFQCISKVTNLMSDYLSYIWGYELRVLPCDIGDGDLDYRFPFWANTPANQEADISHGSKGQREVFDFVFVLAIYKALGLKNYPIFMDELSSGFDEYHKERLVTFIKTLISEGHQSQIFMISHDATSHFKMVNADIVVIDKEGVSLPAVYNKYVTME